MKLRITATGDELATKGEELLKALAHELRPVRPDLAEVVSKALDGEVPASNARYPALRAIEEATIATYRTMLDAMMVDIEKELDGTVGPEKG